MADNTRLNAGTGGDLMATDEVSYSGDTAKVQLVRLVDVAGAEGSKTVSPRLGLTDAELRATAVPVSGTFFQATQPVSFTWQGLTDAELRASAVPVSFTWAGLTDAQLRASAVPVSFTWQGLTDAQLRAANVPVVSSGDAIAPWPGYSGASDTAQRTLNVDDYGALVTRGAVVTDEGTFRCNFANTSFFVSLGVVTVAGNVVTGSGFLSSDVHYADYFKIAADADTLAVQIDSVDSDTQITLKAAYTGSASGTGNRSLVKPVTGAGGSLAVASGQLTITAGTTAASTTGVIRYTDYGPLVYRTRLSISQRIANQTFNAGLRDDSATPKWFAWFVLDGTTNTTAKCVTGRNPTGAPSAAETQTSTVTLPYGATTATARDYRVELLTESVRFYVDGVLVAEHTTTIPHQHDELASVVEFVNGTTPATSTTATVDYLTGKNHNKLEIGVMSDAERMVAAQPPLTAFSYNVAGVIAINTDVLIIDCRQLRTVSLQATSIGTTGRLDFFLTNDMSVTGTAQPAYPIGGGAGVTTTTATGHWVIPTGGSAFLRVRLGVATTAGTTTIFAQGSQAAHPIPAPTTQPVSGTVALSANTPALAASTNRAGFIAGAGIWYDDSSTVLAAAATFTGTSRDATVTATATAFANAATYAKEVRVSAESDQSGTLWLEVSRDNTNWRRVKSVATAAIAGGGQYAEVIHLPSWRYWRAGFTNGATLQTRFTIGSVATAL